LFSLRGKHFLLNKKKLDTGKWYLRINDLKDEICLTDLRDCVKSKTANFIDLVVRFPCEKTVTGAGNSECIYLEFFLSSNESPNINEIDEKAELNKLKRSGNFEVNGLDKLPRFGFSDDEIRIIRELFEYINGTKSLSRKAMRGTAEYLVRNTSDSSSSAIELVCRRFVDNISVRKLNSLLKNWSTNNRKIYENSFSDYKIYCTLQSREIVIKLERTKNRKRMPKKKSSSGPQKKGKRKRSNSFSKFIQNWFVAEK